MTNKAISPLRRRMIEDMTIGKLGPKTQTGYIRADKNFAAFLGRSPDRANIEDIRRYQLHLASSSLGVPSANSALTGSSGPRPRIASSRRSRSMSAIAAARFLRAAAFVRP